MAKPRMFDFGPGVGAAFFQEGAGSAAIAPKYNSRAIAEDAAAHSAVVVSGRKGFASMINGYYIGQTKVLEAGLPTYKSTEKDETGRWRYLFFHSANNAWACAHEIGADDIVAYARGICTRPDQVTTVWIVVSTDGEFVADSNVRCGLPPVAASQFRRRIRGLASVELNTLLTPAEVIDLCSELKNPVSQVQQLKLDHTGLDTSALAALFHSVTESRVLTHLQIRNNKVTDNAISAIAKALKANTSIRLLSLRANQIGDGQMLELGKALRWNQTLEGLSLRENKISEEGAAVIISALGANPKLALRGLALYDNQISKSKRLSRGIAKLRNCVVELTNPAAVVPAHPKASLPKSAQVKTSPAKSPAKPSAPGTKKTAVTAVTTIRAAPKPAGAKGAKELADHKPEIRKGGKPRSGKAQLKQPDIPANTKPRIKTTTL